MKCLCGECSCRDVDECSEYPCNCCWLEHGKAKLMRIQT